MHVHVCTGAHVCESIRMSVCRTGQRTTLFKTKLDWTSWTVSPSQGSLSWPSQPWTYKHKHRCSQGKHLTISLDYKRIFGEDTIQPTPYRQAHYNLF